MKRFLGEQAALDILILTLQSRPRLLEVVIREIIIPRNFYHLLTATGSFRFPA